MYLVRINNLKRKIFNTVFAMQQSFPSFFLLLFRFLLQVVHFNKLNSEFPLSIEDCETCLSSFECNIEKFYPLKTNL